MTPSPDLFHPSPVSCTWPDLPAKCAELKAAGAHIQTIVVKPGEYELHLLWLDGRRLYRFEEKAK